MSKKKTKKLPQNLSPLPVQSPDKRDARTNTKEQSGANVERAKRWGEEHGV